MENYSDAKEIWKQLYDYKNYEISDFGRVRNIGRSMERSDGIATNIPAKILKPITDKSRNKKYVVIRVNGKSKPIALAYAVAVHFIHKDDDELIYARQISDDLNDYKATNIEWITRKEARNTKRIAYQEKHKILKEYINDGTRLLLKKKPKQMKNIGSEQWLPLYDFKGYEISNLGKIRSVDRLCIRKDGSKVFLDGKELNARCTKDNPHLYSSVQVYDEKNYNKNQKNKNKTVYLHKAVADHFVEKPAHILEAEKKGKAIYASHIEKDYSNNAYTNVHWITHKELMGSQPNRLADPTKSWRTRWAKYGNNTGSSETPKWNTKQAWETRKAKGSYPYGKKNKKAKE